MPAAASADSLAAAAVTGTFKEDTYGKECGRRDFQLANCTKCQHAKEIARLRDICLGCAIGKDGCGLSNSGHCVVSLDAAKDENCRDMILSRVAVDYAPHIPSARSRVNVPDSVLPYLLRIVEHVTRLNDTDLLLLAAMMKGERLTDFARRTGVTLNAVHARWKKILSHNPMWRSLATGKIGKGVGRKPKRTQSRGTPQMRATAEGA